MYTGIMIIFGTDGLILHMDWSSQNFVTGRATTRVGMLVTDAGPQSVVDVCEAAVEGWNVALGLRARMDQQTTLAAVRAETSTQSTVLPVGEAGQRNMIAASPNTALLETMSATGKGPRYQGRRYWPSLLSNGEVGENGLVGETPLGLVQTSLDLLYTALSTVDGFQGLAIPQSDVDGQVSSPVVPWPLVGTIGLATRAATQRRRLRR